MSDFSNLASAPGDLRPEAVASRYLSARTQFRHDNTIAPRAPREDESVSVRATSGSRISLTHASIRYTTDGSKPDEGSPTVALIRAGVRHLPFAGAVSEWVGVLPGQAAGIRVRYQIVGTTLSGQTILAQDGQGFWFRYEPALSVTTFAYRVGVDPAGPDWLRDAVIYQVFLDRFHPHPGSFSTSPDLNARRGGTVAGITASLDYLDDLGVTCIWISPIGPAPSYHNYDATDYFSVDPGYGTVDDIRELSRKAHDRGIRLILDFVPSHFSRDHEFFVDATTNPNSKYRDWFVFYEWPDRYRSFLEAVPQLVSLNTDSEGVRDYLIQSAHFWLEAGFDGFRLDHVIGHGTDFWCRFQEALERKKPDVVTIGEATDTVDALVRYAGTMNAILDFPVAQALRRTFGTGDWNLGELDGFLSHLGELMANGPARVSFFDNHDMDRFLHVANGKHDQLLMALVCLVTLGPTPVIYYGTEVGMTHEAPTSDRDAGGDALCRQEMIWDKSLWNGQLQDAVKSLVSLRKSYAALIGSQPRETLYLNSEGTVLGYRVGGEIDVWFNLEAEPVSVAGSCSEVMFSSSALVAGLSPAIADGRVLLPARSASIVRA